MSINLEMNPSQEAVIRCAYLDLLGAFETRFDSRSHDWDAHELTLGEMENVFKEILADLIVDKEEDEEEEHEAD